MNRARRRAQQRQTELARRRTTHIVVNMPHYTGSHEELKQTLIEMSQRNQLTVIDRPEQVATDRQWAQIRKWLQP